MNVLTDIEIPIVIVGFGNADDVVRCLSALGKQRGQPAAAKKATVFGA